MPLREYFCPGCNRRFEVLERGAVRASTCPECRGTAIRPLVSRFTSRKSAGAFDAFGSGAPDAEGGSDPAGDGDLGSYGGGDDFGGTDDFGSGDLGGSDDFDD